MSLYFTLLFAFLVLEMVILFALVLPLPNKLRKIIFHTWRKAVNNQQSKTVVVILAIIVGLLFVDSWKRANLPIKTHHMDETGEQSLQLLATRAYNQRNVYISGFILYFMIAITTVMSVVGRLIKYQDMETTVGDEKLVKELKEKETEIESLNKKLIELEIQVEKELKADEKDKTLKKTD